MTFEEKLEQVLCRHIDGCSGMVSVERLSGGASQETYRIVIETDSGTRPLAMRRSPGGQFHEPPEPGQPILRPGLDIEALLMGIARSVGVPTPEVYHVLTRDDDMGDGFIMQWLDGEALGYRIVRDDRFASIRPKLALESGKILARIHAIDIETNGLHECLPHITPEQYVQQTWARYQALDVPQPMVDYVGRWLMDHLPTEYTVALVHNEFRNGNIMVAEDGITGVLDWEIAHIGDPMRDLGWICTNAWRYGETLPVGGFGTYEQLFQGYEECSGEPVDADSVRFWEVFGCFWWSVTCLSMADMFRHGQDKSIERAMVGRRTSEGQIDSVNLLLPGPVTTLKNQDTIDNLEMPRPEELLLETTAFLRNVVMNETTGRTRFLARVASNATDILYREQHQLAEYRLRELSSLRAFFHSDQDLATLRWRLVRAIRDGTRNLDDEFLKSHLRHMAVYQIGIDNPRYSGLEQALAVAAGSPHTEVQDP